MFDDDLTDPDFYVWEAYLEARKGAALAWALFWCLVLGFIFLATATARC